jgi:glucokinase
LKVLPSEGERPIPAEPVLLGDIGATNARFALLAEGELGPVKTFEVAHFARFADAARDFLKHYGEREEVVRAALAVAGPVENGRCVLTNCPWVIDAEDLYKSFGLAARIVNDFEAVALSLPSLTAADVFAIGGGAARRGEAMAVLGPGTGLGVAGLIPGLAGAVVISGEGGHVTLAATDQREDDIIRELRRRFGHVSAERALSGQGLENIYQAIAAIDGLDHPPLSATEITHRALGDECPAATETLETFCAFLGSVAGNVALTYGARGGVYIAGGISPRILDFMGRSQFRNRFEAKGRFERYLEAIPSFVIVHPAAAFVGLKSLSDR